MLKLVGAVYLIWIGLQMLRTRDFLTGGGGDRRDRRRHAAKALRQGLLSDLGNPKVAVFFTSFLPQFVHGDGPAFLSLLLLGGLFAVLTVIWLAAYATAVGHASAVMRRPAVRRALDRCTGVVLIGFGISIALERR